MAKTIVIVDKLTDWNSYYPVEQLMTPQDYLVNWDETLYGAKGRERIKIINLCRNYKYLSNGYYCSLLAEARGHSVIPSIKAINDLSRYSLYNLDTDDLDSAIQKALRNQDPGEGICLSFFFGRTHIEQLQDVARAIFDLFPAPILKVDFEWHKKWTIRGIRTSGIQDLSTTDEDRFASALDHYSGKIWRRPKAKKKFRYDLAILHNPADPLPPSNKKALANFIKAGKELDVQVELLEKKDFARLAEFDALFIRETTALNHHTYRFAKKAESEGLVVIDDSMSILRCTNKIYLQNLLHSHKINAPRTQVVSKDDPEQMTSAAEEIGFPMIVKIPDGSFSRGIYKVETPEELTSVCDELFKKTSLLLIQEYFYTDFDWRIGVLKDKALFACKYYMTRGHWQIYSYDSRRGRGYEAGHHETVHLSEVPKNILSTALRLSHHVGESLYGVDLKEKAGRAYVIEINDNPNIDSNIEDAIAGMDLYHNIIHEFVKRIEEKR